MVLSETRGLSLFRVVREGLESALRLGARGTSCLTYQLRLALEPKRLENPTATAREIPGMERTGSKTLKLLVISDTGRRNVPPSSRHAK